MAQTLLILFGLSVTLFCFVMYTNRALRVGAILAYILALAPLFQPPGIQEIFDGLDARVKDLFFLIRGESKAPKEIVIVDIDQASLNQFGQWPFPRNLVADAIGQMLKDQPKAIGVDILFAEEDRLSLSSLVKRLEPLGVTFEKSAGYGGDLIFDNDLYLGKMIQGQKVVMSAILQGKNKGGKKAVVTHPIVGVETYFPKAFYGSSFLLNTKNIQDQVSYQGLINHAPGRFGMGGEYPLFMVGPGENEFQAYPSLALQMVFLGEGLKKGKALRDRLELLGDHTPFTEVPLDQSGRLLVNHYGGKGKFPYLSFRKVINGEVPEGFFKDKYVLFGSSEATLSDSLSTPFSGSFPGVEIHATVIGNLLNEEFLYSSGSWAAPAQVLATLLAGLLITFLSTRISPLYSGFFVGAILLGIPMASFKLFEQGRIFFPFSQMLISFSGIALTTFALDYLIEGQKRKWVTDHFNRMVSPFVLQKLKEDPALLQEPIACEGVVMFIDLEGFTRYAEREEAKGVIAELNTLLEVLSSKVLAHEGFIDKFLGDGLMAVWGIPYSVELSHVKACACALEMIQEANKTLPSGLKLRIGIATGPIAAGFLGGEERKNFTAIGDTVNIAARLEKLAKDGSAQVVVCEKTAESVKEYFEVNPLGSSRIKGREGEIKIWEIQDKRLS